MQGRDGGLASPDRTLQRGWIGALHVVTRSDESAGDAHGVHVNLCGEMAGRPLEAMALIGLGLTSISMAPAAIGPVKTMILTTDRAKLWAFMEPLLTQRDHSLRLALTSYAKSQGIRLI